MKCSFYIHVENYNRLNPKVLRIRMGTEGSFEFQSFHRQSNKNNVNKSRRWGHIARIEDIRLS